MNIHGVQRGIFDYAADNSTSSFVPQPCVKQETLYYTIAFVILTSTYLQQVCHISKGIL